MSDAGVNGQRRYGGDKVVIVRASNQLFYDDTQKTIAFYCDLVDRVAPADWCSLSSFRQLVVGGDVEADSMEWADRLFQSDANPYRATKVERSFHGATEETFDLLRHIYRIQAEDRALDLEVVESVQFVLIRVNPSTELTFGVEEVVAREIAGVAERILMMRGSAIGPAGDDEPYEWSFLYERPLGEGARFSTAPAAEPMMLRTFAGRLDGGIRGGVLFFLAHKIHTSGDGRLIALSGQHWFDGKCWQPYGRLSP